MQPQLPSRSVGSCLLVAAPLVAHALFRLEDDPAHGDRLALLPRIIYTPVGLALAVEPPVDLRQEGERVFEVFQEVFGEAGWDVELVMSLPGRTISALFLAPQVLPAPVQPPVIPPHRGGPSRYVMQAAPVLAEALGALPAPEARVPMITYNGRGFSSQPDPEPLGDVTWDRALDALMTAGGRAGWSCGVNLNPQGQRDHLIMTAPEQSTLAGAPAPGQGRPVAAADEGDRPHAGCRVVVHADDVRDLVAYMRQDIPYVLRLPNGTEVELVAGDPQGGRIGREFSGVDELHFGS